MTQSYMLSLLKLVIKNSANKKFIYTVLVFKKAFKKNNFDKIICFMESAYCPSILTGFPIIASVRVNPEEASFLYRTVTLCF